MAGLARGMERKLFAATDPGRTALAAGTRVSHARTCARLAGTQEPAETGAGTHRDSAAGGDSGDRSRAHPRHHPRNQRAARRMGCAQRALHELRSDETVRGRDHGSVVQDRARGASRRGALLQRFLQSRRHDRRRPRRPLRTNHADPAQGRSTGRRTRPAGALQRPPQRSGEHPRGARSLPKAVQSAGAHDGVRCLDAR